MDFTSKVDLLNPDGTLARADTVTINHPVELRRDPDLPVRLRLGARGHDHRGEPRSTDGPVVLGQDAQPGDNPLTVPWVGFVKLPTLRPQVAIELELYPDSVAYFAGLIAGVPQPMTQANASVHALFGVEGQAPGSVAERVGHETHAPGRDRRHRPGMDRRSRSRVA